MKMKKNQFGKFLLIGCVLAVAFAIFQALKLDENLVVFLTPAEAIAQVQQQQGRTIRIGAMVVPGTVEWNPDNLELSFTLSDLRGHEISVLHKGTPPDMFKAGSGVVVEGMWSDDETKFLSRRLIVKHSEEYRKPGDHERIDPEAFRDEILKNQKLEGTAASYD